MLLLFSLLLVASIPKVQTYFGFFATKKINNKFGTNIKVEKVGLQFNGDVELKNILIKDYKNDSLISINELNSSVLSFVNIFNNKFIFGEINIYGLFFNIKTYKGDVSTNLDIFANKFKKNRIKPSNLFKLSSTKLTLRDSYLKLSNENKLSTSVLDLSNLNIRAKDFLISGPNVSSNIKNLSFTDARGIEFKNLKTQFKYTLSDMIFEGLNINTEKSNLDLDLKFSYNPGDFKKFNKKVKLNANFRNSSIDLSELNVLYPEFGATKDISFRADLEGTLNELNVNNLNLISNGGTIINGNFLFKNLISSKYNPFQIKCDLNKLSSTYLDLKGILPRILGKKLPSSLEFLGVFIADGDLYINDNKIDIDINVKTELGDIQSNLTLNDINVIDLASYDGELKLLDFDLGTLIEDTNVGSVSTSLNINGKGLTVESISSNIDGIFERFEFNNYDYSNVEVLGFIENRIFSGQLKTNDLNLKLYFKGLVDFSKNENIYDFSANIKQANLNALNFNKSDKISFFSGNVDMDMEGTNLDDLRGEIKFTNTQYENQNDNYYFKDFQVTSRFDSNRIRTILIDSPEIISGTFQGIFKLKEIPKLVQNSLGHIYYQNLNHEISPGQSLNFNFNIYNKIIEIFYPNLELGSNTLFKGILDSDPNKFILGFKSPNIRIQSYFAKRLEVKLDNSNPIYNSFIEVDSLSTPYFNASDLSAIHVNLNDTLFIKTQFKSGKQKENNFDFNLFYTKNDENYIFGLRPSEINFKNTAWQLNANSNNFSKLEFNPKSKAFTLDPIRISYNDEKIIFRADAKDSLSTTIDLQFDQVDLAKVTPEIDSLNLGGIINGELNISKFEDTYFPKSLLEVNNFTINGFNLGAFNADITGNSSLSSYDIYVKIQDDLKKSFSANGKLDISENKPKLNLNLNFKDFILNPLNPFGGGVITNIRGMVSGVAYVNGYINKPQINGLLLLDNGGISVPYLGIDYEFNQNTKVSLQGQSFEFNSAKFTDSDFSSNAELTGKLSHINFTNWSLDALIKSNRLLVLNTKETEESLYYGTGFVAGDINISGPMNQLFVDANVSTSKGTIFKIPLNDSEVVTENSFIKFVSSKDKQKKNKSESIVLDDIKGLEMEFNMDVTDDAEIEIVIDRDSGSSILGRGNGSILAQINTSDKFQIFGDFLVLSGYYNYNLGKIINKKFKLVKDGSLLWNGDPLKAEINIQAVYDGINVNPSTLLDNPINQSIPVEVKVNLTGALEKPDLDFDISFPKVNSTLNNELKDRLRDKDKRQFQALSLLTTGSFRSKIALDSQDAFELVSDGVANVLNDIFSDEDNKVKLGLDLDIGKNTPDYETDSRVGVTLSTRISENILINGKVGVPVGGVSQSTIAGDFEVEVLLNEDRTLSLKFFNRENSIQNFGEQIGYTQGLGLSYNIEFDNLKELLAKLFSKKERKINQKKTNDEEKSAIPQFIKFK